MAALGTSGIRGRVAAGSEVYVDLCSRSLPIGPISRSPAAGLSSVVLSWGSLQKPGSVRLRNTKSCGVRVMSKPTSRGGGCGRCQGFHPPGVNMYALEYARIVIP